MDAMSEWRRADLGDLPEVGMEISVVEFYANSESVSFITRRLVEFVVESTGGIYGPGLSPQHPIELPARPEAFNGPKAVLWKEYQP